MNAKKDFPILSGGLTYLDSAATSQKPSSVIDAMDDYYRRYNSNVHRGVYKIAEEATTAYEAAHKKVAEFLIVWSAMISLDSSGRKCVTASRPAEYNPPPFV